MTIEAIPFDRVTSEGLAERVRRPLAVEMPVALEFNGIGYAVLMATPADLDDLVTGFALSERLIDTAAEIDNIVVHEAPNGVLIRARLAPSVAHRIANRVRHRVTESSCGLCGIENLEQALRPLPRVAGRSEAGHDAVFRAVGTLKGHQPLNAATGAVHAAALCAADGTIRLAREDVGRHNAFDKLIGAMARDRLGWDDGFALLSSRCSYELVEKAVLAGCPTLVTVSMATTLAVARAAEAGLELIVLARPDSILRSG